MKYEERMPCRYDTEKDLVARLGNSIVRYDGKPVRVLVEGKSSLRLCNPVTGEEINTVKPNDPLLDISCPELGYANLPMGVKKPHNKVVYIERIPYRQFHQGLLTNQLMFSDIGGGQAHEPGWPYSLWLENQ